MTADPTDRVPPEERVRHRDNVGSTARDHLANERTYLAWLRTGFGTAALGIGVAKLLGDPGGWKPVAAGLLFVGLGTGMLLYGTLRYFRVLRAIDEGMIEVGRAGPINFGIAAATFVVIVAALLLL